MKVFLIGFMGSGKSTVGGRLARRLGLPFVDLDAEIVRAAGCPIAEIFERFGEEEFRRMEVEALHSALSGAAAVVATGGGLASQEGAFEAMEAAGTTVWLDPDVETVLRRLAAGERRVRPLARDEESLRALYARRLPDYRRARIRVPVAATDSADEVARRVVTALEDSPCAT
ncbi:MAG: shikimate kinase [Acidobacteria bacterium]|nr:shikimate kinase [Acidobacteriota bacterium]